MTRLLAALSLWSLLSLAGSARAQPDETGVDPYYRFDDDGLLGGSFGAYADVIRVHDGPVRTLLIRPRVSFVPEMFKSVEHL